MYDLSEKLKNEIIYFGKKNNIDKIVLFGSRARGDNSRTSDVDLAIWGGDANNFFIDVDEKTQTLLQFDVVDMNSNISDALKTEIERDGVILYEKIW